MKRYRGLFIILALLPGFALFPPNLHSLVFPDDEARGDSAMAERYALWSKNLIDGGYWAEAVSALERASDFADVSSDISYLLALSRFHENKPRGTVLGALEKALALGRWNIYSAEDALLLKAETFIALRLYSEALAELSKTSRSPREAELTLKALAASRQQREFRRYLTASLDRYPRDSALARVVFTFFKNEDAAGRNPNNEDVQLLELVIRRLPVLLLNDAELAWMAAPFIRDIAEARRQVSAYRAVNNPLPASLPVALKLGVIGEETALEELFSFNTGGAAGSGTAAEPMRLDITLLGEVWELLRKEEAKALFRRNLSSYSGVIIEDADRDGIPETSAEYKRGMLVLSCHDPVQDGIPELTVFFEAGDPRRASYYIPPENDDSAFSPMNKGSRKIASVLWERYPAVEEVELDGARYIPRPLNFYFSPVKFVELWGSALLFPRLDHLNPPLTRRVMVSQSLRVERPSLEFSGGTELVELNQGIPVRAREFVGDLMVSETDFLRGRPLMQRLDLNLDGRMETFRHFKRSYRPVELEELWDYDRDIDYTLTNEE